jgi:polysaccharide biosynthesis protein PslH
MNKSILVISPVATHPQTHGNRQRIYTLLLNLKALGHDVHFVYVKRMEGDEEAMRKCWGGNFLSLPYTMPIATLKRRRLSGNWLTKITQKALRKLKSVLGNDPYYNYLIDDWYDESLNEALVELANDIKPDVVIVEYVFLSKALEHFKDDVLKIIDTHDIFANRYKSYLKNNVSPKFFSTTEKQEDKGLNRADVVFTIQQNEANILRRRLKNKKIITVGHTVSLFEHQKREITSKILFIGSDNDINVSAISYFIEQVFPAAKLRCSSLQLLLVGNVCSKVPDFNDCIKMRNVEDLKEVYDMADIVINPVQFGTGLKIKNIEALGYSKPLITTPIGADGMEDGAGKAFLVANTPQDFVEFLSSIIADYNMYESLALNAYSYAETWNQKCLDSLSEALELNSIH